MTPLALTALDFDIFPSLLNYSFYDYHEGDCLTEGSASISLTVSPAAASMQGGVMGHNMAVSSLISHEFWNVSIIISPDDYGLSHQLLWSRCPIEFFPLRLVVRGKGRMGPHIPSEVV